VARVLWEYFNKLCLFDNLGAIVRELVVCGLLSKRLVMEA
jgi:hypothetical protein